MKHWQIAEGKRHAVDALYQPAPGDTFRALCGAEVTTCRQDYPQFAGMRLVSTCQECHVVWCQIDRIQLN